MKKKTNQIDRNVVQLVAAQVLILTLMTLLKGWIWLALLLAADFALRAFTSVPSPLAIFAKVLTRLLRTTPRSIFAPPKRFAAGVGLFFSLAIALFLFLHLPVVALTTGVILLVCATLEALFNICVGCYVYNWVVAPLVNRK